MHTRPEHDALDEQFATYISEAEEYGVSWWARNEEPQASRLAHCPGLSEKLDALARAGTLIQTEQVYRDETCWDSARCEFQRHLLEHALSGAVAVSENEAGASPVCFITLGLPGSGKTRALRRILTAYLTAMSQPSTTTVCDADELRVQFPEYASGLGSLIVQKELVRLAYGDSNDPLGDAEPCLLDRVLHATEPPSSLVVDTIGSEEHTPPIVRHLSDRGLDVHVLVTRVPVEQAVERAKERALATGRIVMPEVVRGAEGRPERALEACLGTGRVAAHVVVDTSDDLTQPPPVVATDASDTYGPVSAPVAYW